MSRFHPGSTPSSPSPMALFRFSVVSLALAWLLRGEVRAQAVEAVAAREHATPWGDVRRVSRRTVYRWLAAYEQFGLAGLESAPRQRTDSSVVLPEAFVGFLQSEKERDPRASSPELIRRARELGILKPQTPVDRTTVWRACRRMGLTTRRRPHKKEGDTRRFAFANRLQMVLADGKHFRAGADRRKRVALFFLDDCTRYALHVIVGTREYTELFLRGLYQLLRKVGFFDVLYLDHGPGFRSDDTAAVVAQLPHAHLVLGTGQYPEGHGKIEKFNQTALWDVLRSLDRAAEVDPDCGALTLRLQHYLDHQYNVRPHDSLGNDTPRQRWQRDPRALRFPDDEHDLRRYFVIQESRQVSADHVIRHSGLLFEAPHGLARGEVTVHRHVLDGHLEVPYRGKMVRLHPVDLQANATARRALACDETPAPDDAPPKTAATLAFDRDCGPVVGPDGGFTDPTDTED